MRKFLLLAIAYLSSLHASPREIHLKAPDLSDEAFIEAKVGIRPYRKSGVRLESEFYEDKLIIHNYGYGGSGITLCWGGSQMVQKELDASQRSSKKIAVLGAGVIGLSTAYDLLKKDYHVTIYADEFSPNLTSDIAAGIWSPPSVSQLESDAQKEMMKKMLGISRERFLDSIRNQPSEFAGIQCIDNYAFKGQQPGQIQNIFSSDFNDGIQEVLVNFDNGLEKQGTVKKILAINGKLFLQDLFQQVKDRGANIIQYHFETIQDILHLDEDIVINCTSFGSEQLFNDQELIPIRGHLLFFKNVNKIDYMAFQNAGTEEMFWINIYPRGEELLVGGSLEVGIRDASLDPVIVEKLLENVRWAFSASEQ